MSVITEILRADAREHMRRAKRFMRSTRLRGVELQENYPIPRRYPRDRVLRRLVKIDTDFQRNRSIKQFSSTVDDE